MYTQTIEINHNINKLSNRDRMLLYHYFVLNIPLRTLRWLYTLKHSSLRAHLIKVIKKISK